MKKKISSLIFAFCLLFSCTFVFSACSDKQNTHTHTWGEWQVKIDATCSSNGKKNRYCSICGDIEEQIIPAGHDWVEGVCSKCGDYNAEMDTTLSDGRVLTNIVVSKTGLLRWTGLKVASKYVLTFQDSSGKSHTYTISKQDRKIDLANLSDKHTLDFGKNSLTLTAYEIDSIEIDGETYEEEIPITTAKDTFTIVKVNSGYSIVRKTYSDEFVTIKNFDSLVYHDEKYGDYLLYEQAGKKGSKYIANKTTFSLINNITTVNSAHSFKIYLSEESREDGYVFDESEKIKMLGGESQWIYIDIIDENESVVKSYTTLLYCTRPLTISLYSVERAQPDSNGDIVVTQNKFDIGEISVTENNILNIDEIYEFLPQNMLIRDINYNIYERNTDYNTKDMPITGYSDNLLTPGEITLYFGNESEVRKLSAEIAQFTDTFTLDYYVGDGDIPYWEIAYNDNHNDETIVVPSRIIGHEVHLKTYSLSFWNSSVEHIILESGIKKIPENAFKYCTKLKSIKIPNTVTWVGAYLFASDLDLTIYLEGYASQGIYHASWCAYGVNSKYSYLQNQIGCCSTMTKNGITYKIENSSATVIGTTGDEIVIPETINFGTIAYTVKKVESFGNSSFTKLVLPKSVISFPESEIPSTLLTVEVDEENRYYKVFEKILYKNSTILFISDGLTELKMLKSVTQINNSIFGDKVSRLSGVETIYIHEYITDIDLSLFENNNIKAFIVDENNTVYSSVDGDLYSKDKTEFIRVAIGKEDSTIVLDSVTTIQKGAFKGYTKGSLTLPFVGGSLTENQYFGYIFGLDSYSAHSSIPSTLKEVEVKGGIIGNYAFAGCDDLTSITIGSSVQTISSYAFYGCNNLTSITIGSSVQTISGYAFAGCVCLTEINFNAIACDDLNKNSYAFSGVGSSSECTLTFGEGVTKIPAYLFYDSNITSVKISSTVTSIGDYAFSNCEFLKEIKYNATACGYVSSNLFYNSGTKESGIIVTIGEGVTKIPDNLFYGSNITSVTISNTVTSIGYGSFSNCEILKEINFNAISCEVRSNLFENSGLSGDGIVVTIGEGVTKIPASMFFVDSQINAPKVISVTISNSVVTIGNYAFEGCSGLTSITIPNSVVTIGNHAFEGCSGLTSIVIPSSVTSIGKGAFANCELEHISVEANNTKYKSDGNYILTKDGTILVYGGSDCVIPNSVTTIGEYAFSGCSGLSSITIPNSVTTIGEYAFSGCSGLSSITIPEKVTSIKEGVFLSCNGLTSIIIPRSIKEIFYRAFAGCNKLSAVYYCGETEEWNKISHSSSSSPDFYSAKRFNYIDVEKCCICEANGDVWTYFGGQIKTSDDIEWHTDVQPTQTSDGSAHATCPVCGENLTKTIKVLETEIDSENPWEVNGNEAKATDKKCGSSTSLKLTANADCKVRIYYLITSESSDELTIYNGSSGRVYKDYHRYEGYQLHGTITLSAGDTITFTYKKDNYRYSVNDCVWVKWEIVE